MIAVSRPSATYHSGHENEDSFTNDHLITQNNNQRNNMPAIRSSANKSFGADPSKICNTNLNAAIASSLHIREQHGSHDISLEYLNRNISFHQSSSISFDTTIKERIIKMSNSIILKSDTDATGNQNKQILFSDNELLKCCQQSQVALPRSNLGFQNAGNTCYLNSVLQCFLATGSLLNYVREKHGSRKFCSFLNSKFANGLQRFCALCGICRLIEEHDQKSTSGTPLFGPTNRTNSGHLVPSYFVSNVRAVCPNMRPYQQEDAHEYLLGVLSRMEESVLAAHGKISRSTIETNVIRRIFGGTTKSEVTCSVCKKTSPRNDHWFNLSMDITHSRSLQQCLVNYTQPEILQGTNAYKCETCKQFRHASRCSRIFRAPPILVIQFNRFSRNHKLDNYVDFPASFNLRPHMTVTSGSVVSYRLYATLNHEGYSCRSGHYVAFTKRNNQWLSHNDSMVTSTTLEHVLRQSPYLLFYELTSLDHLTPTSDFKPEHVDSSVTNSCLVPNKNPTSLNAFPASEEKSTISSISLTPALSSSTSSSNARTPPNSSTNYIRQSFALYPRVLHKAFPTAAPVPLQPSLSNVKTYNTMPSSTFDKQKDVVNVFSSGFIKSKETSSVKTFPIEKYQPHPAGRCQTHETGDHNRGAMQSTVHRSRISSQTSNSSADSVVWVPVTKDDLIHRSVPDSFTRSRKRKHRNHENHIIHEKKSKFLSYSKHRQHTHKTSKHKSSKFCFNRDQYLWKHSN